MENSKVMGRAREMVLLSGNRKDGAQQTGGRETVWISLLPAIGSAGGGRGFQFRNEKQSKLPLGLLQTEEKEKNGKPLSFKGFFAGRRK